MKMTFAAMDANFDGSVTKEELVQMLRGLGENVSDAYVFEMIKKADTNHDGTIQFDEFIDAATSG